MVAQRFFPNGYGISIVRHSFSYGYKAGLWEVAVLVGSQDDFELCYDTPIANDVLGWLEGRELRPLVEQVRALPRRENES